MIRRVCNQLRPPSVEKPYRSWVPHKKSVAYFVRYREIALQSNSRYLSALARFNDPTFGVRALDVITTGKQSVAGIPVKAYDPLTTRPLLWHQMNWQDLQENTGRTFWNPQAAPIAPLPK